MRMDGSTAPAFDRLMISPQFIEDLRDIERDDPDGARKVARTVCHLMVDMTSVDRRRVKNARFKLFRTRPPGQYRSVDWPQGRGATALLRVSHRKDIYRWVERYAGEAQEDFLPVQASRMLRRQMRKAAPGNGRDRPQAVSDPVPRGRRDDPVGLSGPDDMLTIARRGMEEYLTILSDEQRDLIERLKRGPAVIRGPAGSGKTVMALHLARHLHQQMQQNLLQRDERILLLDFGRTLRENLRSMLAYLCGGEPPDEIEVINIHRWCEAYVTGRTDRWRTGIPGPERTASYIGSIRNAMHAADRRGQLGELHPQQVLDEISSFIIPRRIQSRAQYLEADRRGRGFALREEAREKIWKIYRQRQQRQEVMRAWGYDDLINLTLEELEQDPGFQPYRYVIVDEAQDFSVGMLRLARMLAGDDESRLFLFGDVAQSLYDPGFRWKDAELAISGGRVRTLKNSHRCGRRIFQAAGVLINPLASDEPDDYDDPELFAHTGQKARVIFVPDEESEILFITEEIQSLLQNSDVPPQAVAVLAPSHSDLRRLRERLQGMGIECEYFRSNADSRVRFEVPAVKLITMHSAKGLGFPYVFIRAPAPEQEKWDEVRERKTLFTAMTRAGVFLALVTRETNPHPLVEELVSAGQVDAEHPG